LISFYKFIIVQVIFPYFAAYGLTEPIKIDEAIRLLNQNALEKNDNTN